MEEQQNIIIYRTADGRASVALYAKDGKIWLNQQQMGCRCRGLKDVGKLGKKHFGKRQKLKREGTIRYGEQVEI